MLTVGQNIIEKNLLLDVDPERISNGTCYLTIAKIISGGDEEEKESVVIGSGEIVWVVSRERFNIDANDAIALVTLKSGLTKQGLLALDTGFVDPGFEGPIGTVLVNFSKNDVSISTGDEFFRVIFIEHGKVGAEFLRRQMPAYSSVDEYAKDRKKEIARDYSAKFLNTDTITSSVKAEVLEAAKAELKDDMWGYFLKRYWWKLSLSMIAFAIVILIVGYLLVTNLLPSYTSEEIKLIVEKYMDANLLPPENPTQ